MSRHHTDWIKAYLRFTSHLEAPPAFHLWTAVSTIAGALRGKCWIDMGYFRWKPNFFVVFVAPPGIANKSSTSGVGMDLLRRVDGINFGPDAATWQALTQSLAMNVDTVPFPDGTHLPMSCMTIAASELGTFLDVQNREMIDVLVDLWDGRNVTWKKITKTSGEDAIPNPWINLIAGTTPAWIGSNMPEYAIGGGFTSRCVFVHAESKHKLVAYPHLHIPPDHEAIKQRLVEDLVAISQLVGPFRLSDEAIEIGTKWYNDHWERTPEHLRDDRIAGYVSRKQTHLHKIAMVLSAARRDDMLITADELNAGLVLLGSIELSMNKVFNAITDDVDVKAIATFIGMLKQCGGGATKTELYRRLCTRMSFAVFEEACRACIGAGHVQLRQLGDNLMVILLPTPPSHLPQAADTSADPSAKSPAVPAPAPALGSSGESAPS